ncbi:MAG TPA: metal ABC transporter permease [Synergistales bacterium]|nr:metal ABC transporter permease [Synergistales bacterium]
MFEVLQYDFMRNAILAAFLASAICGVIGTLVVIKRFVILAGGIAHAAYGGIGMALYFGFPPRVGAISFSCAVSLILARITLLERARSDTIIGVIWAVGMALGVIFADLTPGYGVHLMSYLFGSILSVNMIDLYLMGSIAILTWGFFSLNYRSILVYAYDEDFARTRGIRVTFFHYVIVVMISLSVVMLIRVVGLILVIALLTIPPYMGERFSKSLMGMALISFVFSLLFCFLGLLVSYELDLTSGASIILVAGGGYFLSRFLPARER